MFIVFGSPRSGTSLLSSTLHTNDNITIPDETDFLIPTSFIIDRVKDENIGKQLISSLIVSTERFRHSLGEYLTVDDIHHIINESEYSLSAIVSNIYQKIASNTGAIIAGDKSPNDLNYLRSLVKVELFNSDIKIIHIVRDIRDVILSLKKVNWNVDWKSNFETYFPRFWSNSNLYLNNLYKNHPGKYFFTRYEDMIKNPLVTFQKLSEFLNVPFQERMLDSSLRGEKYLKYEHHQNLKSDFMLERIDSWKQQMEEEMDRLCQAQAKEALVQFGYSCN